LRYLAEQSEPERSIAWLAKGIGALRPSVSRSLRLLKAQQLVMNSQGWQLTEAGIDAAASIFRPGSNITWLWGDMVILFICPCGDEVLLSNEAGDNLKQCGCGCTYRFTAIVEVSGERRREWVEK
jgi:hypothetical protein